MLFADFAQNVLEPLEKTSKKLEQTRILTQFLQSAAREEIQPALYLVLGQNGPIYQNQKYNFGVEFMLYALTSLTESGTESLFGASSGVKDLEAKQAIKQRYKKLGDLGLVAEELLREKTSQQQTKNTIVETYQKLLDLAAVTGQGSQDEKIGIVGRFIAQLDPISAKYVVRMIMGNLRLGFSDKTILDSLSWFLAGDKSNREALDAIYQRHPDIGKIAEKIIAGGVAAAQQLDVELGVPILSALCDRLKSPTEAIEKMGEVLVEPKYDGTRVQIHWNADKKIFHTFTRNLEENTQMFPELPKLLSALSAKELILDCEAVGYDPETNNLVVFQQTIKRKRKHDIESTMESIPLRFFVFDILYKDGQSLLREPLQKRRAELEKILSSQGDLILSPSIQTTSPDELRDFHQKQLAAGLEGVVIKQINGPYQSGRKAFNWVKLKEAEGTKAKLSDTIDAVILGLYAGRGKRTQFGVGAFLVGILNPETDTIVTIAKIGTGLSDEQWHELKQRADEVVAKGSQKNIYQVSIPDQLYPDILLPAQIVVEVAADEITQSPMHTAGVALRFPRLVRFRDDKGVSDITTVTELTKIHVA